MATRRSIQRVKPSYDARDVGLIVTGEIWAELIGPGPPRPSPYGKNLPRIPLPPYGLTLGVIDWRYTRNKIGSMGVDIITIRVGSSGLAGSGARGSQVRWLALGSVGTAPSSGNTRLGSEWRRAGASSGDQRLIGTFAHPTGSKYFTLIRTFQAGTVTGGVREAGAATRGSYKAGSFLNRGTFAVLQKGASDTIKLTVKTTFTPA